MKKFTYTINNTLGIHARPAGFLVKKASEFESNVILQCNEKSVNLKTIMAVMAINIKYNQIITVVCEGKDEEKAANELEEFFHEYL